MNKQLENFEKAFTLSSAGCRETCRCGMTYFDDSFNSGWDWEDGELESLRKSDTAFARDYGIQRIAVGGLTYASDCDCWHQTAAQYIRFFNNYKEEIAEFYKLEKERLLSEADAIPVIETEE